MPPSQIIAFSPMSMSGGQAAGKTRAVVPLNTLNIDSLENEEYTELPVREAGVFDRGFAQIDANTVNGVSFLNVRKSRADTAIAMAVAAGLVGPFTDLGNAVLFAASDEMNWKCVSGGTSGAINAIALGLRFVPTDPDVTMSWAWAGGSGGGMNTDNATRYLPISGTISVDANPAFAVGRINGHFTARNLAIVTASNPRTTSVTVRSWINGAFGQQVVTIPAGFIGVVEDTQHSDVLAPGDDYGYAVTTLGGGGLINWRRVSSSLVSTNRQWLYSAANINGATFSAGIPRYVPFAGNLANAVTTESVAQIPLFAQLVSNLSVFVSRNTLAGPVGVRVRVDGGDGSVAITIPAGQVGLFQNLGEVDSIGEDQRCNLMIDMPNGTGAITLRSITLLAETASALPAGKPSIKFSGGVRTT